LVWHAVNAMFFEPICWTSTCVNRAIVDRNHQSFFVRCPSSRKDHLFEENKYICHKIIAIHFSIIWKSVDNIEPSRIPYNREHKLFALNLLSRFYGHIISRQSLHPTWWCIKEKSGFVTSHKIMPAITLGSMQ
jgi:hypothetical protein